MRFVLSSPIARCVCVCGMLQASASLPERCVGSEGRSAASVTPEDASEAPSTGELTTAEFTLPPSATTRKLVLVSAEMDAQADQPHVSQIEKGSSSRRHRRMSVEELPWQHLTLEQRQLAADVVNSVTVYRRLPAFQCELDPRVHDYFIGHPDVAVSIWRAMAISCLQLTQCNAAQYEIDTQDGTTGIITVLHQSRENCLVHCEGLFKSPYLKEAICAKSLMHLKTRFEADEEGRTYATHQADLFVAFPSQKVSTIAKLISPVSNAIIDRNFQEISLFIHVMWLAMSRQPGWVEQIAGRLEGVSPTSRDELIRLTAEVYVTAQTNLRRRTGLPVSLETIRPPSGNPRQSSEDGPNGSNSAGIRPVDVTR